MEDECELYTVKDFQEAMQKLGDDVYSVKMTKIKLKERYGDSLQFVNREGRSDIILLDNISVILTESWYDQRKSNQCDEAERIIKTAAKILKGVIKNHTHQTDFYPTIDDIRNSNNDHVPDLLKLFVAEVIKSPLKQISISQALFAASKARSLMPLQFGLAVATDNRLASKWLNTILSRLGFSVSYDEVFQIHYVCIFFACGSILRRGLASKWTRG